MSNLGNKKTMAKNIRRLMNENNMNSKDVYTAIGVPQATFSNWINAETYPRIDKIEKMAKLFNVSKAELVEENYISLNGLTLEQMKQVKVFIKFLKGEKV
jgi:transcriptional regulator with XRE-family HTH domain